MLTCAIVFCWAKPYPRETISGLFGRRAMLGNNFWRRGRDFINWLHQHEVDHCFDTWACENAARKALGYHG